MVESGHAGLQLRLGESRGGEVLHFMGQSVLPKVVTPALYVSELHVLPGQFFPVHLHPDQDETLLLLQGSVTAKVGGIWSQMAPLDLFHIPRGTPHGFKNDCDEVAHVLVTLAPGGSIYEMWREGGGVQTVEAALALMARHGVEILSPEENE